MISDKEMCDFLYSIVKQLEVKNIDWDRIASEHGISNAHAARMRWHRFKTGKEPTSAKKRKRKAGEKGKSLEGFGGLESATTKPLQSKESCFDDDEETSVKKQRVKRERPEEKTLKRNAGPEAKVKLETPMMPEMVRDTPDVKAEPQELKAKLQKPVEMFLLQPLARRQEDVVDLTREGEDSRLASRNTQHDGVFWIN